MAVRYTRNGCQISSHHALRALKAIKYALAIVTYKIHNVNKKQNGFVISL